MCGLLFSATVVFTDKIALVYKKLYPKSLLVWLLLSFGIVCGTLINLAQHHDSVRDTVAAYLVFFSGTSLCVGCILAIRHNIRKINLIV
jgi:hypothetical protein